MTRVLLDIKNLEFYKKIPKKLISLTLFAVQVQRWI